MTRPSSREAEASPCRLESRWRICMEVQKGSGNGRNDRERGVVALAAGGGTERSGFRTIRVFSWPLWLSVH